MKKTALFIFALCVTLLSQAAVTKSLTGMTAGGLKAALTAQELTSVTNLIVTGVIDARDFKTMRDDMTVLADIDLSGTTVAEYTGTGGTGTPGGFTNTTYPQNTIPIYAFWNYKTLLGSLTFPKSITSIGEYAFCYCLGLTGDLNIPEGVEHV